MAKAALGLPLLPLLVLVSVFDTNSADATIHWSYYGCYEFDFSKTIFFNTTEGNTISPGCKNCKEQQVITPNELPHHLRKGSISDSSTNTPQECMNSCNRTGYSYAGALNGNKCICANEHPHSKTSYESCNIGCSGNENKTCGGDWKMNLYGASNETSPFPDRVSYMGCYSNTLDRLLTGTYDNNAANSPTECIDSCIESGYAYAGLQYKTQCICANEPPHGAKQNESSCDYTCPGDASKKCGGHWKMNVYRIAPPVNCTWSDWTWDSCSKSCGSGTQNGTRTISMPAKYGGTECTGQSTTYQSCNPEACPISRGGGSHLMIVGQQTFRGFDDKIRFISLSPDDNPLPPCLNHTKNQINIGTNWRRNPALFPSIDGHPLLCGGNNEDLDRSTIRYDGTSDSWTLNSSTLMGGKFQAWDYRPDVGLIIAGGQKDHKIYLSTDYGQTKINLPDYPIYGIHQGKEGQTHHWYGGCAVIVNTTTVFFAGGRANLPVHHTGYGSLKETFYLNIDTKEYTRGPDLTYERHFVKCSLITEPFPQIVIVDGYRERTRSPIKIVDILNLATNEITRGPDLPLEKGIYGHTALVRNEKVLIFGGHDDRQKNLDILEYDGQEGNWTIIENKLPGYLNHGSAMFIDNMRICS